MLGLVIIVCISAGLAIGFTCFLGYQIHRARTETLRMLDSGELEQTFGPPGP